MGVFLIDCLCFAPGSVDAAPEPVCFRVIFLVGCRYNQFQSGLHSYIEKLESDRFDILEIPQNYG